MGSDVDDVDPDVAAVAGAVCSLGWDGIQACRDSDGGDMAYRHSIECVNDVGAARQLNTTFEQSDKKVIGQANTTGGVSKNVARSDDGSEETASASLADELF